MYSPYNTFQQKSYIQSVHCYYTNKQKNTGKGWKVSVICRFYFTVLKTRHAAAVSSRIKGNETGTEIKLHALNINISEIHLHVHPTKNITSSQWCGIHQRSFRIWTLKSADQNRKHSIGRLISLTTWLQCYWLFLEVVTYWSLCALASKWRGMWDWIYYLLYVLYSLCICV